MTTQVEAPRLVDVRGVAAALDISVPTAWRWNKQGILPKPLKVGPNSTRWLWSEIEAWIGARASERRAGAAK